MIVGGNDIVIEAAPDAWAGELIVARIRRLWPDAWVEDVDGDKAFPIDSAEVRQLAAESRQFFVYEDRAAADAWEQRGGTPDNQDRMIHVMLNDPPAGGMRSITLVVGAITPDLRQLLDDLAVSLKAARPPARLAPNRP